MGLVEQTVVHLLKKLPYLTEREGSFTVFTSARNLSHY